MWVYMRRDLAPSDPFLPGDGLASTFAVAESEGPRSWRITANAGPDEGIVEVGLLPSGTGIVEWLHVDEAHRGRGLGKVALSVGLRHLASLGATEVILYVDHDAPGTERDRTAALALYESVGFEVVDHLHGYERIGSEPLTGAPVTQSSRNSQGRSISNGKGLVTRRMSRWMPVGR
jgi:ribosomal protein S18 acetylase RimI-like enzyme